ncbi:MAG: glycosyltransferase [Thermoanaerobaculia bacterium]|nr:glycosyltransferase [Thermoanaerobaculia bacterium]
MTPRVSVVIPSYNHAIYLAEAVESVLSSPLDLELVIVDDGSTDGTCDLLQRWQDHSQVHIHRQENSGAHAALNRGLAESRGEFLFILNSDDRFAPDRIASFVERFDADPELLTLTSWIRLIDDSGQELGIKRGDENLPPWEPRYSRGRMAELHDPALSLLETNYISTSSNLAFRRRLLDEQGLLFPSLRYTHDWYFALAAASAGKLEIVPEPLVDYRVHAENTIKEGAGDNEEGSREAGVAAMHFEILWTLASHSHRLRQRHADDDASAQDLARRQWRSLPPFVTEARFAQFLHLRGEGDTIPPAFWELLELDHPLRVRAIPSGARATLGTSHDLSIVIPTRDRVETLRGTLEDLIAVLVDRPVEGPGVERPRVEVIVVDDGSSTPLLRDQLPAGLDLTVQRQPPRGPAAARNLGIAHARAPRVLLLGDDTPLRPGALDVHLDPAREELGVQGRIDWDPELPITDLMQFLAPNGPQFYFAGLTEGSEVPYCSVLGSNLSAPTHWFRAEPFDEGFPFASFEDTELAFRWHRRGWPVHFSPLAGAWHRHHYEKLAPFLERQRRAGASARRAVGLHPKMLWKVVLAPAIVTAMRSFRRPRTEAQRWDLDSRRAFFAGWLRPQSASASPVSKTAEHCDSGTP